MKKYKIKPSKKQLSIMKEAWRQMNQDYSYFFRLLQDTEEWMQHNTGINDLEFFKCDGDYVGIGNASRTMKLIQGDKLE